MTFDGYSFLIAAESDTGIGWGLILLFVGLGKWGWLVGLGLLAMIVRVRRSHSAWFGAFVALALPISLVLMAISIVYFCFPLVPRGTPLPEEEEVRAAVG